MTPRVALTIAGSDSGGGAGAQADLRCFAALGVHGTSAITAVTAQNTLGVRAIHPVPPGVVDAQISAVVDDLCPASAKTGMLATAQIMEVVAARATSPGFPPLVVDPVMVASTGAPLIDEEARHSYLSLLFPLATVATPNLAETAILVGHPVATLGEMADAARRLHGAGPKVVVVKGGHLGGPKCVDVVFDGQEVTLLSAPRLDTRNLAGTGCTFSAAIAAYLALGLAPVAAITSAKGFVAAAIAGAASWALGSGQGPLDPFSWVPRPTRQA